MSNPDTSVEDGPGKRSGEGLESLLPHLSRQNRSQPRGLPEAFVLFVERDPLAVFDTLQIAQEEAELHIAAGAKVEIQTTSCRAAFWHYRAAESSWVQADASHW